MQISLILAHPDPLSFNHAIAFKAFEVLKFKGHEVFFHDLYKENFDPLLAWEEIDKDAELPSAIKHRFSRALSSSI